MSYQDLGAWAPGEDPGTLYGDPRLNQRARPGEEARYFHFNSSILSATSTQLAPGVSRAPRDVFQVTELWPVP